ncbi:MAG: hypothetical protein IPM12_00170 [Flavobacteriales bacterium]|nr:hypothetical protein [Flavobacteriales bacterium]
MTGDLSERWSYNIDLIDAIRNGEHGIEAGLLYIDWRMPYGWLHQYNPQVTWVSRLARP